jgi:hypothetical protein
MIAARSCLAEQMSIFKLRGKKMNFGQWARVDQLVCRDPGEGLGGDVAHAVAGGLDRMHVDLRQAFEDVRHLGQFDPVELHVLPRGEVAITAIVVAGDAGQRAHLLGAQGAVGNRNTQHVGVLLQVQAVLQAQRQELLFAQLPGHEALDLIAELRNALEHQRPVVIIVLIHATATSSGRTQFL